MKNLLQRLMKFAAYSAAGVVILLAVAVGLFRLFVPRLPEYQEEIKEWASTAVGMNVEFSGMDARWGLRGPELKFYGAELIRQDTMARIVAAEEVSVGVGVIRLLVDRTLVVDRIIVRNTSVEVRQLENGRWKIQGSFVDELLGTRKDGPRDLGGFEVIGQDVELQFLQPGDQRPHNIHIPRLRVRRDNARLAVDATVLLPGDLGGEVDLVATQLLAPPVGMRGWDMTIDAEDLELAGLMDLLPPDVAQLVSGSGDIDLSVAYKSGVLQSATAEVDFKDILHDGGVEFDVSGRIEFHNDPDGWLVAADGFQLTTPAGEWPASSLRVETSTAADGHIVMLDLRASYVNLADLALFGPWLSEQQKELRSRFDLTGVVRDLVATSSDVDTRTPRYDVSANLDGVGFAPYQKLPEIRGFSGQLRANQSGGRLEIESQDVTVGLPNYVNETIMLDDALGTVIWRRSNNRTTILSDSIAIRNADFDSELNIELTLPDGGGAPVIDLASTWSVTDISSVKRFLPEKVMKPKTYQWLQQALVSGRIPRGTTRLYGPLDKFPFDGGEGRLLIEANVRDATLRYSPKWPAAELIDLDVVLDNLRLYSVRSHSTNVGNEVINAQVEIPDFRNPILTIDAFATGTLESIRQFAVQSPIGKIFGGQLDRITVAGGASFNIDLVVPIRDWRSFEFTTRIRSDRGSLQFEGLDPPVTELSGVVTIDRDTISSEALVGQFLGQPIAIELLPAPESLPNYRVVANVSGLATAPGLIEGFGVPLENFLSGAASYTASLLFPRGKQEIPPPLRVHIESDLVGIGVDLPVPLMKSPGDAMPLAAVIEFPRGAEKIHTNGEIAGLLEWQASFAKVDDLWDFDRGVLALGDEPLIAAETRGLHLRGRTESVRLQDWFDLSKRGDARTGVAERIRSIDMTVDNLYLLGQHLSNHRVRVDRSAQDWMVQFEGENIVGSAVIPYDFAADRELILEMEKLVLPGDEDNNSDPGNKVDPRSLPTISLKAEEFAFGDRYLGAVEAKLERTENGFEAHSIVAKDESFEIIGSGNWLADDTDPAGHRSSVSATLTSTDIARTMQRLNYTPGIIGEEMGVQLDVSWSGGPREDFMDSLDGDIRVRFGVGQLVEVEPGAGRMFGLISIAALPRRLSLDFRDVFEKGFGFDNINGSFRLVDGEAYTCDLSLSGPAADIGIVGHASLVGRDYEQTAVVSANVGSTLPLVGAVIAGPQVAAALLIFSQIFKKPLQDIGQVYYSIGGTWDEPIVNATNDASFVASGELAGCVNDQE